jgi:hypothetical protein
VEAEPAGAAGVGSVNGDELPALRVRAETAPVIGAQGFLVLAHTAAT